MVKILQRTGLALALMLFSAVTAIAETKTYALQVDGLACPFCAFGIEKQLSKMDGVDKVTTDIKAGVVLLTMKDGVLLDNAAAEKAVERAGFTLEGIEQVQTTPQDKGDGR